jgi:hypothetical protein
LLQIGAEVPATDPMLGVPGERPTAAILENVSEKPIKTVAGNAPENQQTRPRRQHATVEEKAMYAPILYAVGAARLRNEREEPRRYTTRTPCPGRSQRTD